jgi:hypothetical protein
VACLEQGGTASVVGQERGMVAGEGERPAGLCSFFLAKWGGRPVLLEKDMFRVTVLFVLPPKCAKLSPLLCMCWKPLFIGKKMARFPNFVPQLLSFFFL